MTAATTEIANESAIYAMVLGRVICSLREERGLNQTQLAEALGLTQSGLSRIERGATVPDAYVLRRLAEALGLDPRELTGHVEKAMQRTQKAAEAAAPHGAKEAWWSAALKVASVTGFAGLVAFAVAVALHEDRRPEAKSK